VGTEVTKLVLNRAFRHLDLERITLVVLSINERAIACYSKCGFVEIGREADALVVDGAVADDITMAITVDQFRECA
jgi:RimJ/RimL family protein N-acetyltransferase